MIGHETRFFRQLTVNSIKNLQESLSLEVDGEFNPEELLFSLKQKALNQLMSPSVGEFPEVSVSWGEQLFPQVLKGH